MIAFLSGKLLLRKDKFIIVDVSGVGYKVFLSQKSLLSVPKIGEDIKLFTYHNIKEEASDLYGFFGYEELDFFELLMDIRGVGPKAALEISAVGPLEKIKDKVLQQDENVFAGIPGIGSKKAMSIILELTGKIKTISGKRAIADPAEDALVQLGFSKQQAKDALNSIDPDLPMEEKVKLGLKSLGK